MTKIRLMHRDNMEFMASTPDKFYELAIVDPPYGIKIMKQWGVSEHGYRQYKKGAWDDNIPSKEYFNELQRVSKNQIIWGGNYFTENVKPSQCWLIWDKGQRDFSMSDAELAWCSFNKTVRIFEYSRGKFTSVKTYSHPTEKPIDLYKWLLQNYATKGDKILDTHGGSMSIAIACADYGYDLDLCELDADYYKDGVNRVKNHLKQSKMFGEQIELILT